MQRACLARRVVLHGHFANGNGRAEKTWILIRVRDLSRGNCLSLEIARCYVPYLDAPFKDCFDTPKPASTSVDSGRATSFAENPSWELEHLFLVLIL